MDLTLILAVFLLCAVAAYVLLDGFDLGVGILFPWGRDARERDEMMNSVAPFWDGNETWLVMGGTALFAAFPLAYAVLMPALYVPALFMLLALIFRGVAFEFRFKADRSQGLWDQAFFMGSAAAAFFQGTILAAVIEGVRVEDGVYAGGPFDWLTPFALFTGLALACGYGLLGACWLIYRTRGPVQAFAYRAARVLLLVVLIWMAVVSVWTPVQDPDIAARWLSVTGGLILAPTPVLLGLLAYGLWRSLRGYRELAPFLYATGLFAVGLLGLMVSLWPYAVPRSLTLWDAAADPASQMFFLVGVLIFVPFIVSYTVYVYRIFRGKVRHGGGGYG